MNFGVRFISATLSVLMLSGCFGGYAVYPLECDADYPLKEYIYRKDSWGSLEDVGLNPSGNPLSKDDFLKDWGKPDENLKISSGKEMWVYNRSEYIEGLPVVRRQEGKEKIGLFYPSYSVKQTKVTVDKE